MVTASRSPVARVSGPGLLGERPLGSLGEGLGLSMLLMSPSWNSLGSVSQGVTLLTSCLPPLPVRRPIGRGGCQPGARSQEPQRHSSRKVSFLVPCPLVRLVVPESWLGPVSLGRWTRVGCLRGVPGGM